jgi:hypothetical protein
MFDLSAGMRTGAGITVDIATTSAGRAVVLKALYGTCSGAGCRPLGSVFPTLMIVCFLF